MAITEKLSFDDIILTEIIRHPVMLGEFYRNLDLSEGDPDWEYSDYQKWYLGDFNSFVSLCCGRAVGKTVTLSDFIIWMLLNDVYENEYIVYTVPNKVHLEPVFNTLVRLFRNNDLLKYYVEPKRGINSGSHIIKLLNSAQLTCRIAGQSGTGANVVGLHTPVVILDEAGFYPWGTWMELQPIINTWQEGFKLFVAGVPTGLREKNVLYYVDEVDPLFSNHRTSAHENPRYSEDDEERNLAQYGGAESEDYVHFVLGRHGSPIYSVFDRRNMTVESYPVHKIKFSGVATSYQEMVDKLSLIPRIEDKSANVIIGVDLGYVDPTSILIMTEKNGIIREYARINFTKVNYNIQEKLIDYLDTRFGHPPVIAIDVGNEQGLVHHLTTEEKYYHKDYDLRVFPVKFGSWLTIGEDADGGEIKVKLKPHSVAVLQQYANTGKIAFTSNDMELVTELERMTYRKNQYGDIIYTTMTQKGGKRGADHNTAALLCAIIGYHLIIGEGMLQKKAVRLLLKTDYSMV